MDREAREFETIMMGPVGDDGNKITEKSREQGLDSRD